MSNEKKTIEVHIGATTITNENGNAAEQAINYIQGVAAGVHDGKPLTRCQYRDILRMAERLYDAGAVTDEEYEAILAEAHALHKKK